MKKTVILFVLLSLGFTLPACTDTDINSNLRNAAQGGNVAIVQTLLAKGADVNAKDKDGWTVLMEAVFWGHTEVVKLLLAKGADVNAKTKDSKTALMKAVQGGRTEIVDLLKQHDAKE